MYHLICCIDSADALELYSQALQQLTQQQGQPSPVVDSNTEVAVLSSNIAAVLLKLDRPQEALQYATAATQVGLAALFAKLFAVAHACCCCSRES